MRTLSTLLALALLGSAAAAAQISLRIVEPVLSVDGQRVVATGAPLAQSPFGVLTIGLTGYGTYTISDRPFAGARRAGQFDGEGLYFAVQGHSIRLLSREPILSLTGPVSAYVAFQPSPSRHAVSYAQLSVADDPNGRGRRSLAQAPAIPRARVPAGPRRSMPAATPPTLTDRPASRYLRDAEVSRLRAELNRLVRERQQLASERDRLMAERAAPRPSRSARGGVVEAVVSDRPVQLLALEAERDRLAAESRRLAIERDQIAQAYDRVVRERDGLSAEFAILRRRAEDAEARTRGRQGSEARALRAEVESLRAALAQRDASLETLEVELAERGGRLPAIRAELAQTRRLLNQAIAERDAAVRARDVATAEAVRLRSDLSRLEQEIAELRASGGSASSRRDLLERLAAAELVRDQLTRERDALADEVLRLRTERAGQAMVPAAPEPRELPPPPREAPPPPREVPAPPREMPPSPRELERPSGAIAYLPGFDFGRLQNPDDLQLRLDTVEYPDGAARSGIEGDVLVLFETDTTGRVVRSAVPAPVGGGLDALAEGLVRSMRFEPPRVDGEAAPLRSQVLVRFEL